MPLYEAFRKQYLERCFSRDREKERTKYNFDKHFKNINDKEIKKTNLMCKKCIDCIRKFISAFEFIDYINCYQRLENLAAIPLMFSTYPGTPKRGQLFELV